MYSTEATVEVESEEPKALARTDDLLLEQLRLVHDNSLLSQLVALFNSSLLAYVQWSAVDHGAMLVWLLCMTAVSFARLQMAHAFQRTAPSVTAVGRWRMLFLAGVTCSGLLWGAAGVVIFPADSFPRQVFTAFVIAGMVAGSAATLSPLLVAFVLFVVPALLPIMVQFLMRGDQLYFAMSLIAVLYGLGMLAVAKHLNAMLRKSMALSLRNAQLVRVLTKAKAHAEMLNIALQDEVAERRLKEQALREGEAVLADAQRMAHLGSWSYHPVARSAV